MKLRTVITRSLRYHWRSHIAVVLGTVVATATITGALLVGDSMRGSLLDHALDRIGLVDHALLSQCFFPQSLAERLGKNETLTICPIILTDGGVSHAANRTRANNITVIGADQRFWKLNNTPCCPIDISGRSVAINQPLAKQLQAKIGDDLLIRIGKYQDIPSETLLGRRDDTTTTVRLTVAAIVPPTGLGSFSPHPDQQQPLNVWIPLNTLQRAMHKEKRINSILVSGGESERLAELLTKTTTINDFGLSLRLDEKLHCTILESESFLLTPQTEQAALDVAGELGLRADSVLTYLANSIETAPDNSIAYSTITAIGANTPLTLVSGEKTPELNSGEILLNQWAADELNAQPGQRISLSYYVTGKTGELETKQTAFTLRGIVRMDNSSTDRGFAPPYPGITDAENLADWDPPFPVNFKKLLDRDEEYWDKYKTAPKAFLSIEQGRQLWSENSSRFGQATSVRIQVPPASDLNETAVKLKTQLLNHLHASDFGLTFDPLRERITVASRGSTDFGMLFIGFSFFLIASALILVALLFRLHAEQRATELGTLAAIGFTRKTISRLLTAEGFILTVAGCVIGLLAAAGYAWLMLAGLKTFWADAANAPFLTVHVYPISVLTGLLVSLLTATGSITWSIHSLTALSPRALLAGKTGEASSSKQTKGRITRIVTVTACIAAIILMISTGSSEALKSAIGFFSSGTAFLIAAICLLKLQLERKNRKPITSSGNWAITRLGIRNASRQPLKSLLTAGLIASATFIIIAIQSMHLELNTDTRSIETPTGGFELLAESSTPLPYDLGSTNGQSELSVSIPGTDIYSFRFRPGEKSSCRNLYTPGKPRIIGAPASMIERGGFLFSAVSGNTDKRKTNPWLLLNETFSDGSIPAIADESVILWQYHLGIGKDLIITNANGDEVRLRFVASLAGSSLADEIIISETNFLRLLPSTTGYGFFLIDTTEESTTAVTTALEEQLEDYALDVTGTVERLSTYLAMQNTYLSTFQTLGGLGLLLGTFGLAVVLLRNTWLRRSELALLRSLGFSLPRLGYMILVENAALVVAGLLAGSIPALVAIAPHILTRSGEIPWMTLLLTLTGVLLIGLGTGAVAVVSTLRAPMIPALRSE